MTWGHDIRWLVFESAYRSESLCTCRQKHWGRGLTHTARRFQLHVCVCQGALPALPFVKTTSGTRAREASPGLDVTGPLGWNPEELFCTHPTASPCKRNCWEGCRKSPEIKAGFVSEGENGSWFWMRVTSGTFQIIFHYSFQIVILFLMQG